MKKRILSLLLVPLFLTACGNSRSDAELKPDTVKDVSDSFLRDFEECKNKDYINLDLSECSARFPEFEKCGDLEITVKSGSNSDGKEMLQSLEKYCTFFLGGYNSENALFSSSSESIVYNEDEDDGKYAWYPKVNDYIDQIQDGSIKTNSFLYRDIANSKYLWWNQETNFPHWISKGEAYSFIKTDDTKISSWIPSDMDNKVASYFNDGTHNDEVYQLLDGDVSVGDAVTYFEENYLTSLPYSLDDNYSLNVSSIDVYEIQDNLYCYVFNFSTAFNSIAFDIRPEAFSNEDTSSQYLISGEALMIKRDDIDTIVDLRFPEIQETSEQIDNICSLSDAMDIVSNKLTQSVKFEVQTIEFVYKGNYSDDFTTAYVKPSWKFLTYNPNDNYYYCVYVDAVSGECSYISYTPLKG